MDAAKTHLNRIAFIFLTLALAVAAPWSAQAQTFTLSAYGPVTLSSTGSGVNIAGTGDSSANYITFTASSITYSQNSYNNGVLRQWLEVGSDASCLGSASIHYRTPVQIPLNVGCFGQSGGLSIGTYTATVNLTSTSPAGLSATITVTFTINSGTGGTGVLSAYSGTCGQNCVSVSAPLNGTNSTTVTLSTTNVGTIAYSTNAQPVSWLTVSPANGSVSASQNAYLSLYFNAAGYGTATTLSTTIYVTYNGTSSLPITVTFLVGGGGTGTLSLSPGALTWNYYTGGSLPTAQSEYLVNSTAASYVVSVNAGGYQQFLSTSGSGTYTSPFTLYPLSTITSLATGTYYNYVTVTDTNGLTTTMTVTLTVNNGSSNSNGVITISPNPIQLNGAYLGSTVSTPITVTSTQTGVLAVSVSGENLSISTTSSIASTEYFSLSVTANQSITLYVIGAPIGNSGTLGVGTYGGAITATLNSSNQLQIPITFNISNNGTSTSNTAIVAPSSFLFNYQMGTNSPQPQSLSINGTQGGSDTYSISTPSASWLEVGSSYGPAPAIVPLYIQGASSLPVGTSSAYFQVTTTIAGYTTAVQVTVNIQVTTSGSPVLVVQTNNGGSINLQYTSGSANPAAQGLYLSASDGSAQTFTAASSASWITLSGNSGITPASLAVSVNASSLPNGLNSGYITITGSFNSATVPVVVYVSGASTSSTGVLTLSASSLTFNAVYASTAPSSQTFTVSATSTIAFSASAAGTNSGITWLTLSPSGSLSTTQTLTVSVNQSTLQIGSYTGYIYLTTTSGTQTVPVTLNITASPTNALTISPTSLAFSYITGGSSPSAQTVSVTSGSTVLAFSLAYSVTSGGWLVLTTTSGNAIPSGLSENTGFAFLVYANPTGLAAGTYTANIAITPAGGSTYSVPVTLTVTAGSTVSATPSSLNFSYQVGGGNPAAQSISVAGAGNAALQFIASATSTGNWLAVTPTSGNTPAALAVTVSPSSLTAGAYTGTIAVAGTGSGSGSTSITVTLTVTAPLPTITAVVNGASFAGGKIAPGEIVTIGGSNLGPVNGLGLTLTSSGTVSTSLGNVAVSFSGYPAPLIYVSQTQINCVVPYQVAGLVSPSVLVTYAGQGSNGYSLSAGATAPGIFTQNGQGSGPGAVLNASGTVNGPGNPAAKGSTIVIYMTGEGQTSPTGVTGSVTQVTTLPNGSPFTPQPLLNIAVLIGGQPATVTFYGEAPGLVAGVMQVNAIVPAAAASGTDALVVSVGGNPSQSGVTVSVQ